MSPNTISVFFLIPVVYEISQTDDFVIFTSRKKLFNLVEHLGLQMEIRDYKNLTHYVSSSFPPHDLLSRDEY